MGPLGLWVSRINYTNDQCWILIISRCLKLRNQVGIGVLNFVKLLGPSCSKLTPPLINETLHYQCKKQKKKKKKKKNTVKLPILPQKPKCCIVLKLLSYIHILQQNNTCNYSRTPMAQPTFRTMKISSRQG